MPIQSLAVFCGSRSGQNPLFAKHAAELGALLAKKGIRLIYGGGSAGLMGLIADEVMRGGGQVTGIIPKLLIEWEVEHRGITELIICDDMHERKQKIYSRADAAVVMPGGFGTLDELFEIVTWNQLTIHDKSIFILNSDGFYDALLTHIKKMKAEGFLYEEAIKRIFYLKEPSDLNHYLL